MISGYLDAIYNLAQMKFEGQEISPSHITLLSSLFKTSTEQVQKDFEDSYNLIEEEAQRRYYS